MKNINFNKWDEYNINDYVDDDYIKVIKKKSIKFYNFLIDNGILLDYIDIIKSEIGLSKLEMYYNNIYGDLNLVLIVFKCGIDKNDTKWNSIDIKWIKTILRFVDY